MRVLEPPPYGCEQLPAAFAHVALADAANLLERAQRRRLALCYLDERSIAEHALNGPVALGGRLLAPRHQLARHALGGGAHSPDAREPPQDRIEVALVACLLQEFALLTRPRQASCLVEPTLELGRQGDQVHHVLARIGELLG